MRAVEIAKPGGPEELKPVLRREMEVAVFLHVEIDELLHGGAVAARLPAVPVADSESGRAL